MFGVSPVLCVSHVGINGNVFCVWHAIRRCRARLTRAFTVEWWCVFHVVDELHSPTHCVHIQLLLLCLCRTTAAQTPRCSLSCIALDTFRLYYRFAVVRARLTLHAKLCPKCHWKCGVLCRILRDIFLAWHALKCLGSLHTVV